VTVGALVALARGASACRSAPSGSDASPLPVAAGPAASAAAEAPDTATATATAVDAGGGARVCFPPLRGDFDRCPKGVMKDDDGLRACQERHAAEPARHPVFTVGAARPSAFSPTRWRCIPVPLETKVHVTIDTIAGIDVSVPAACASRTFDMIGPNGYGAVFFRCSTRGRADDEELGGE
jgi:hypothetical protein